MGGISPVTGSGTAVANTWGGESQTSSTARTGMMDKASESAHFESLLAAGMPMLRQPPLQAWEQTDNAHAWENSNAQRANSAIASSRQAAPEEDEEELQLAATLRCMGFDE